MTIIMNEPQDSALSPYHYIEFDNSSVGKGVLSSQPQKMLLVGDKKTTERLKDIALKAYPQADVTLLVTELAKLSEALNALPEEQYTQIVLQGEEPAHIKLVKDWLDERWKSILQLDGHLFVASEKPKEELLKLAKLISSKHVSLIPGPTEWAAAFASVNAQHASTPARPYQTLEVSGIELAKGRAPFSLKERNELLAGGVSTFTVNGADIRIDRLVTTDTSLSYRDLNTKQTLSYLRYDFRNFMQSTFPRHMLARDDGAYQGPVVTPKSAKALAIARYRKWQDSYLVQDPGGVFADGVRVEVDPKDPGKLLIYLPVVLMGQLRITHTQISFTL